MLTAKESNILRELEPLAAGKGIEIVTVEVTGARKSPTIRVYLDTPHGVSFDDISAAHEWIDAKMDEIDPFPGAYVLEVSSPGIDRPLRTPAHFQRFVGQIAHIKAAPIDGRGAWTGEIIAADDESVTLNVDGETFTIPYEGIKRAQLKGTIDFKG